MAYGRSVGDGVGNPTVGEAYVDTEMGDAPPGESSLLKMIHRCFVGMGPLEVRIKDPDNNKDADGLVLGRHPRRQAFVAVCLNGDGGLRGYWLDCNSTSKYGNVLKRFKTKSNYVFSTAAPQDLQHVQKMSDLKMIAVFEMPWGTEHHVAGLCILNDRLVLCSRSLLRTRWGTETVDRRLHKFVTSRGQMWKSKPVRAYNGPDDEGGDEEDDDEGDEEDDEVDDEEGGNGESDDEGHNAGDK